MSSVNDRNTRESARQGYDQIVTLLNYFSSKPDAAWSGFDKAATYLEYTRLHLTSLLHCVEAELQRRDAVEPVDYGT